MQLLTLLFLIVAVSCCSAFSTTERRNQRNSMLAMVNDRRSFLDATALAGYTFFTSMPAFADTDDLSMPTDEEQKDLQVRRCYLCCHLYCRHLSHHLCHHHHHHLFPYTPISTL
jgi:hypothetical protein